jgi:hypothetical protein
MQFVYIHVVWFAAWIGFRVEHYPFGLLTMIVSLEAIFLSTFVISQNRADEKRQVLADHQWQTVQEEEQQNEEVLHLSNQILELTEAIHAMSAARVAADPAGTNPLRPRAPGRPNRPARSLPSPPVPGLEWFCRAPENAGCSGEHPDHARQSWRPEGAGRRHRPLDPIPEEFA